MLLIKCLKAIDEGKYTSAVFLDLTKAFDIVDHKILLSKLRHYGFQGKSFDFLCNYLSDRQQRVLFNGELSDWVTISIGVTQRSILGPLLFTLYINNLPTVIKNSLLDLYADDAELHCSHPDFDVVECLLQSDLNAVMCWLCSSQMSLNAVKSSSILIGSQQRIANKSLNVSIGGTLLTQVISVQYLGIIIDNTLSWTLQISYVVSRVRSRVASIVCLGHFH